MAGAKAAMEFFENQSRLAFYPNVGAIDQSGELLAFVERNSETCAIVELPAVSTTGTKMLKHFECCGKKVPFTNSVQSAYQLYKRIYDEYGHRAKQAEANEGIDWKALSHAVRVGYEAVELMTAAHITFPLPNAQHILSIKRGGIPYKDVASEIEWLLGRIEKLEGHSVLPAEVDHSWIDSFVFGAYERVVLEYQDTIVQRDGSIEGKSPLLRGVDVENL